MSFDKCTKLYNKNPNYHDHSPGKFLRFLPNLIPQKGQRHFWYFPSHISFARLQTPYKSKSSACVILCKISFPQHVFEICPCGCLLIVVCFFLLSNSIP